MAGYELTKTAERRLEDIYRYSVVTFGLKTAERYLNGMHQAFGLLADNPHVGTDQGWIRPGYRRLVHESHVIYYRPLEPWVLIVEVLHKSQDPARHFEEELCNRIGNSVAAIAESLPRIGLDRSRDPAQTLRGRLKAKE